MISLWAASAVTAAALQTARNALQSGLTAKIGTIGATQVRFLFGLPFAVLFLLAALWLMDEPLPRPSGAVIGFALWGGLAQIAATALMLLLMKSNGFAISTAWLKGEPVIVALIGWAVLGDLITLPMLGAIILAVIGVLILSIKPGTSGSQFAALKPAIIGLLSGTLFGLSAIGFRGGILAFDSGSFLVRSLAMLALALLVQSAVLMAWMGLRDRAALRGSFAAWRPSLYAGFFGAAASAFWFIAFSLATAAHVRTLALVEVIFALMVSRFMMGQSVTNRQLTGICVLIAGVALLLLQG